jgi:hypothetical protein
VTRKLGIYVASILVVLAAAPVPAVLASPRTAAAGSAASAGSCTWVQMTSRNTGTGDNDLQAVAAISSTNVWAVGQYFVGVNTKTLIEHWNGKSWKIVKSPSPGAVNSLNGIYAVSGSNIWAVGGYAPGVTDRTLIEHWNGTSWKVVKSPNVGSLTNSLASVRGTSATDIWAAGYTITSYPDSTTLLLHWNGTSWKVVKSPNMPHTANMLNAVRPLSATSAWAVGEYLHGSSNKTLILHWTKDHWRVVYSPNGGSSTNELFGVLATSPSNAWAVGFWFNQGHSDRTLILHWNGHKWQKAVSPNSGAGSNEVLAVGGTSARDIYAVGQILTSTGAKALILHWNGRRWGFEAGRDPGTNDSLNAVFAQSPRSIWAVGHYTSSGSFRTLIEHCR